MGRARRLCRERSVQKEHAKGDWNGKYPRGNDMLSHGYLP